MNTQLQWYYKNLFPTEPFIQWLSSETNIPITHRELAFFFSNTSIPARFKSFENADQLKQYLIQYCPTRIDIGGIYNVISSKVPEMKNNKDFKFRIEEKELVFDIDITDYNKDSSGSYVLKTRHCCQELCAKCWPIIITAIKVINYYLIEQFNFNKFIWIFSGRKGVHNWICGNDIKQFTEEMRINLIEYLKFKDRYLNTSTTAEHPDYDEIYSQFLLPCFEQLVVTQNYFDTPEHIKQYIVYYFKDANVQQKIFYALGLELELDLELESKMNDNNNNTDIASTNMTDSIPTHSSLEYWKKLVHFSETSTVSGLNKIVKKIVFDKVYPRLDEKVSTSLIHLLKSPFTIHPTTSKICVPIDEHTTIEQLQQLNINNPKIDDLIKPFITTFHNFINQLDK